MLSELVSRPRLLREGEGAKVARMVANLNNTLMAGFG